MKRVLQQHQKTEDRVRGESEAQFMWTVCVCESERRAVRREISVCELERRAVRCEISVCELERARPSRY